MKAEEVNNDQTDFSDLPNEILEYIFNLLPPYNDIDNCRAVCKRWNEIGINIVPRRIQNFKKLIPSHDVIWDWFHANGLEIGKRYAHSACRYRDTLFIFGGSTSAFNAYNDLWKLNLSTGTWIRVSATGQCPVPKSGASMVVYQSKLILLGGMLPVMRNSPFQIRHSSNNINVYNIIENSWEEVIPNSESSVPYLSGHSATIHEHNMVVIGGWESGRRCINHVYCLNLETMIWTSKLVTGIRPPARFGHSQVYIDRDHLLILGGVTDNSVVLNDSWLLDMSSHEWCWYKISLDQEVSVLLSNIWCHAICNIGRYIAVIKPSIPNTNMYSEWLDSFSQRSLQSTDSFRHNEINLNGKRGILKRPINFKHNYDERKKTAFTSHRKLYNSYTLRKSVELHLLDTSRVIDGRLLVVEKRRKPIKFPVETILYSLTEGNGELILFGGVQLENYSTFDTEVSNSLQIIKLKTKIV